MMGQLNRVETSEINYLMPRNLAKVDVLSTSFKSGKASSWNIDGDPQSLILPSSELVASKNLPTRKVEIYTLLNKM